MLRSRFHNQLTFHAPVMPSTYSAAPEGVSSRCLRHKFNGRGLTFLDLDAVLDGRKNQSYISRRLQSLWERPDLEAMRVVDGGDLELDFASLLHSDRRRLELVFLCLNFDSLDLLICARQLARGPRNAAIGESKSHKH